MPKRPLRSIQTIIFRYFFVLIIVIVVVLDMFFIYQIRHTVEKDTHMYTYEIGKQVGRNMDYYVKHMEDIARLLKKDNTIKLGLTEKSVLDDNQMRVYRDENLARFKAMGSAKGDITSIFVFGENGVVLADNSSYNIKSYIDIEKTDWYTKAVLAKGEPVVSSPHIQNYLENDPKWVFSVSVAIMEGEHVLGVILIDMNYKTISDICSEIQLGERGYVYIVNDDREIVYHPEQELIYSKLKNEDIDGVFRQQEGSYISSQDKRLITIHTIPGLEWKIVGVSYISELLFVQKDLTLMMLGFTGICILFAFVGSRMIAKDISRPIRELQQAMLQVERGDMEIVIHSEGSTQEIASLSRSFKTMVRRMKLLLEEIKENQRKLRKSEFKVLQAQINPHFLYNTLDTIIWLGEKKEYERVVLMASALAKYFRLSLSKGEDIIPIRSEIDHVKNYLVIQKTRYDNKLKYTFDIDPEINFYYTVKLILQPLVENALYHGIKDKDEGGTIHISGRKVADKICFIVEDDGSGMTEKEVADILERPIPKSITTGGVAIRNVHQRLQIYFGSEYGLKYESTLGKGTKVYVTIPVKEDIGIELLGKVRSRDAYE